MSNLSVKISNVDSGKCIDLPSDNSNNGNQLKVWNCNNNVAQNWVLKNQSIYLDRDRNKCWDIPDGNIVNGAKLQIWDCNGANAQKLVYDRVSKTIKPKINSNKCLDIPGGFLTDGSNIQIWDCNGADAQKFYFNQNSFQYISTDTGRLAPDRFLDNKIIFRHIGSDKCIRTRSTSNGAQLELEAIDWANVDQFGFHYETATDHSDKWQLRNVWASSGTFNANNCMDMRNDSSNSLRTANWTCGNTRTGAVDHSAPSILANCPAGYMNSGSSCLFKGFYVADNQWYSKAGQSIAADEEDCEDDWGVGNCERVGVPGTRKALKKCSILAKEKGYANSDKWTPDDLVPPFCSPVSGYRELSFASNTVCPSGYIRGADKPSPFLNSRCYVDCQKYGNTFVNTLETCSQIAGQGVDSPGQWIALYGTGFIYRDDGSGKAIDTGGGDHTQVVQYTLGPNEPGSAEPQFNQHFDFVFYKLNRNVVRGAPFNIHCWAYQYLAATSMYDPLTKLSDANDKRTWWVAEGNQWIGACKLRNVATGKYLCIGRSSDSAFITDLEENNPRFYFRIYKLNDAQYIQPVHFPGRLLDWGGQGNASPWFNWTDKNNDNMKIEIWYRQLPIPRNIPISIRSVLNGKAWTYKPGQVNATLQQYSFDNKDSNQKFIYTSGGQLVPLSNPNKALQWFDNSSSNKLKFVSHDRNDSQSLFQFLLNGCIMNSIYEVVDTPNASSADGTWYSTLPSNGTVAQNFAVPFAFRSIKSGKCIKAESNNNLSRYKQTICAHNDLQYFYLRTNNSGNMMIANFGSLKCMDAGSNEDNNRIWQYTCGADNGYQQFSISNNLITILWNNINKVLGFADEKDTTTLKETDINNVDFSKFEMIYSVNDDDSLSGDEGLAFQIRNGSLCLAATGSVNNSTLAMRSCGTNDDTKWVFGIDGKIRNVKYGVCIDGAEEASYSGAIKTWACDNDITSSSRTNQQWKFKSDGTIQSVKTGKNIDFDGSLLRQWSPNTTGPQIWAADNLTPVDTSTINDNGILDITVVQDKTLCPTGAGYEILSNTDLNDSTRSHTSLYLCGKKGTAKRGLGKIDLINSKTGGSCSNGKAVNVDLNKSMGGSSDDIYLCKELKDATSLHDNNSKNRYVQDIKVKSSPDQTTAKTLDPNYSLVVDLDLNKNAGSNSTFVYMSQNYPVGEANLKTYDYCKISNNINTANLCSPANNAMIGQTVNTDYKKLYINKDTSGNNTGLLTFENVRQGLHKTREYISAMSGKKDADVDEFMIAYGKTLAPKVSYSYSDTSVKDNLPKVKYTIPIQLKTGDMLISTGTPPPPNTANVVSSASATNMLVDSYGIKLMMQPNGNLTLTDWKTPATLLWQTGSEQTNSTGKIYHVIMQTDGNLVIYENPGNRAIWSSGTSTTSNTSMYLRNFPSINRIELHEFDPLCSCVNAKDVDVGIKDTLGRPVIIPGYCLDTQCKSENGYKTDALTAPCQLNLQVCSNEVNIAAKGNVNIGSFVQTVDCTQTVNNNNNNNNSSGSGSGSGNANTNGSSNTTSSSNTPYIIMIGALLIVIIVIGIVIKAKSSGTSEKKTGAYENVRSLLSILKDIISS